MNHVNHRKINVFIVRLAWIILATAFTILLALHIHLIIFIYFKIDITGLGNIDNILSVSSVFWIFIIFAIIKNYTDDKSFWKSLSQLVVIFKIAVFAILGTFIEKFFMFTLWANLILSMFFFVVIIAVCQEAWEKSGSIK